MKFPSLKIHNFLALTEAEIGLADKGLVLISGKNHADSSANSNGAGKSSIADALCWCWFGTTARGASGDDIINKLAGKDCFVESTVVDDDGTTYTATRYRKHKTYKNSFRISSSDGFTTTDLTKGTDKLTQEVAEKILGCSYDVFKGAIYAGQEQMPDLPAMTDKAIKLLLEEAAGVTMLEDAHRLAREKSALSGATVTMLENDIGSLSLKLDGFNTMLADAKTAETNWIAQQKVKIDAAALNVKNQEETYQKCSADLLAFDTASIVNAINDCNTKLSSIPANQAKVAEYDTKINKLRTMEASLSSARRLKKNGLDNILEEIADADHQVGCPCKACGREITVNEIADAKKALEARREVAEKELTDLDANVTKASTAITTLTTEKEAFEASLPDLSELVATRDELQKQHQSYQAEEKAVAALKDGLARLVAERERLEAETNPHSPMVEKLSQSMDDLQTQIDAKKTLLVEAQTSYNYDLEVVKVYSPAGVRAHVMDDITPFLNTQTAKYLGVMSDGNINATWTTLTKTAKGELREKFSIDVENATGGGNFKLLSGGEKRKVRISTALALQDLVATRAVKPIDLFIGDEIDDALDDAGLERLTVILEEKAKERGSVFVISHNEISDYVKNVLLVEKNTDGTSTITEMAA